MDIAFRPDIQELTNERPVPSIIVLYVEVESAVYSCEREQRWGVEVRGDSCESFRWAMEEKAIIWVSMLVGLILVKLSRFYM